RREAGVEVGSQGLDCLRAHAGAVPFEAVETFEGGHAALEQLELLDCELVFLPRPVPYRQRVNPDSGGVVETAALFPGAVGNPGIVRETEKKGIDRPLQLGDLAVGGVVVIA